MSALDPRLSTLGRFCAYRVYAMSVSIQKKCSNTSLRSDAHATIRRATGCQANKAATIALRHNVSGWSCPQPKETAAKC